MNLRLKTEEEKTCIYLLVMPKYWGKQVFTHGRFPKVGQKQKAEKREKKKKEEQWPALIANATSGGARKAAWANK